MKRVFLCVCASVLLVLASCEVDDGNVRLQIALTDAPGDYQEVNIDITGIQIHSSENDNGRGWRDLAINAGVYNLLKLTNGLDTLLSDVEVSGGRLSQIRLVLGNRNSIKVDNQTYALATPSALQSGLKLQVHQVLAEGVTYRILLDFDVARSIVKQGNGSYLLKPVISTITEAQSGAIKGVVDPVEAHPAIYAITGADTVRTTYADAKGAFLLRGLPAGTYTVAFSPGAGYKPAEKSGIAVQVGKVADVGTVKIDQ